jgi:hypothetical protein
VSDRPREDGQDDQDDEGDRAAEEARRRARRRAAVFGDVLPESTRDDRDPQAPSEAADRDDELTRNVPPHHG